MTTCDEGLTDLRCNAVVRLELDRVEEDGGVQDSAVDCEGREPAKHAPHTSRSVLFCNTYSYCTSFISNPTEPGFRHNTKKVRLPEDQKKLSFQAVQMYIRNKILG